MGSINLQRMSACFMAGEHGHLGAVCALQLPGAGSPSASGAQFCMPQKHPCRGMPGACRIRLHKSWECKSGMDAFLQRCALGIPTQWVPRTHIPLLCHDLPCSCSTRGTLDRCSQVFRGPCLQSLAPEIPHQVLPQVHVRCCHAHLRHAWGMPWVLAEAHPRSFPLFVTVLQHQTPETLGVAGAWPCRTVGDICHPVKWTSCARHRSWHRRPCSKGEGSLRPAYKDVPRMWASRSSWAITSSLAEPGITFSRIWYLDLID